MKKISLIIGITGASGSLYGKLLLEKLSGLKDQVGECAVIISVNGRRVWEYELGKFDDSAIPFRCYPPDDLFAPVASGSAGFDVMIICPCTMGTLGRIAVGISTDLMTRAADVMLKERRKLILVPREAPINLIHVKNMQIVMEAGAIICPASPSFYSRPATIDELAMTVVDRVLILAGLEFPTFTWGTSGL